MERSNLLLFLFLLFSSPTMAAVFPIARSGCTDKCGEISIPYPFGINRKECYREGFELTCHTTNLSSPKLFLSAIVPTAIEVTNITLNSTATILYTNITKQCNSVVNVESTIDLGSESPLTFSYTHNKLTAVGCDTLAVYTSSEDAINGCISFCKSSLALSPEADNTCSGVGCCQAEIPRGAKNITTGLTSIFNHTKTSKISNCSHAFPVEEDWYKFNISNINDFNMEEVPVILDWAIGNQTCEETVNSTTTSDFICGANSNCLNSSNGPGYRCACKDGFEGNPYLPDGCQDIDECNNSDKNTCSDVCTNTIGNYTCSCRKGKHGDGKKNGQGCIDDNKNLILQLVLGIGFGIVFLLAIAFMLYWGAKKRKMIKLREKYFEQNGGELLKQKTMHEGVEGAVYTTRIFTEDE